uniref:Uncharacterized protein n=1 Tax=Triticum urartu TaxID=4572 RepID=A0A8R7QF22_TRIUA
MYWCFDPLSHPYFTYLDYLARAICRILYFNKYNNVNFWSSRVVIYRYIKLVMIAPICCVGSAYPNY